MASITRLALLAIAWNTVCLSQNEKEMIRSLQRDVAQLQELSRSLNSKFDEKVAILTTLLQQALEEAKNASRTALTTDARLRDILKEQQAIFKEQQSSLSAPVLAMGEKLNQLEQTMAASTESTHSSNQRLLKLEAIMNDAVSAIRTLQDPPRKPVPPTSNEPPPGLSSSDLYDSALRDKQAGNNELALQQFHDLIRWFPTSALASKAQFYSGEIHYNAGAYDQAIGAFEEALKDAENPKQPDALYMKGMALWKSGQKSESAQVFAEVIRKYPRSEAAAKARDMRQQMGLPAPVPSKKTRK